MLEKYAGLIVRKGVNLQKDQILVVTGDVCNHRPSFETITMFFRLIFFL